MSREFVCFKKTSSKPKVRLSQSNQNLSNKENNVNTRSEQLSHLTPSSGGLCTNSKKNSGFLKNSILLRKILSIESVLPTSFQQLTLSQQNVNNKVNKTNLPPPSSGPKKQLKDSNLNNKVVATTPMVKKFTSINELNNVMNELNRAKSIETISTLYTGNTNKNLDSNLDLTVIECDDNTLRQILVREEYI